MTAIFDASIIVGAALAESRRPDGPGLRDILPGIFERHGVAAPSILAFEVGNVVHNKARAAFGRTVEERAEMVRLMLEDVELVPPTPDSIGRIGSLAESERLTFYDAAYLELAVRTPDAFLLTDDRQVLAAGKKLLGAQRALDGPSARDAVGRGRL